MKIIIHLVIFLSCSLSLIAQNDTLDCNAPERDTIEAESLPWFGNNNYLENFLDSIGYNNGQNRIIEANISYRIPIKFWVYRASNGTGGPTLAQLRNYITNLNRFFNEDNDGRIAFYMKCEIDYIDNDANRILSSAAAVLLVRSNYEPGAINVHITDILRDESVGITYYTSFFDIYGIFLNQRTYNNPTQFFRTTLSHEIGHYLSLDHTHQYSKKGRCRKEAIDRNRTWPFIQFCPFGGGGQSNEVVCEATGDFLRDTPADHDLGPNNSCQYVQTDQTDPWGDHYENPPAGSLPPDPLNIMSYNGDRFCRVRFSRLQIAVMLYSIERGRNKMWRNAWKDARSTFDEYEPDNFVELSQPIVLSEIQERNFHQIFDATHGDNPVFTWFNCDVDWVTFIAPCNGTYTIETFHSPSRTTDANTRLTLFDAAVSQLAQNDNISPTNLFSSITWNFIAGQQYFIRVDNMGGNVTAFYNLVIGSLQLTGVNEFCGSQTYTINAPPGATVSWTINPANIVSSMVISPNQIRLTQIGSANGEITLTGSFVHPCDGLIKQVTRNIFVGLRTPSFSLAPLEGDYCQNQLYEAVGVSNNTGNITYNWRVNGVLDSYHGFKLRRRFPANTTTISLRVTRAGCGESNAFSETFICGSGRFTVSPNPAGSNIKVKAKDQASFIRIRIVDKAGVVKKDIQYPANSKLADIDISNLPVDIYSIQIFDGNNWAGILLSVQR